MSHRRVLFFLLLLVNIVAAEFTIHVQNPWKDDTSANRRDSLRMCGNAEVGYYPGSNMQNEGGGWFYYIYDSLTKTSKVNLTVTTWIGPPIYLGKVTYGRTTRMDSLFRDVPSDVEEIWVVLNKDTTKFPKVYTTPPESKVINILNPWPENSPKLKINKQQAVQMRMREDLCGWYRYYYAGPLDSLSNVVFTDYFRKEKYTLSGMDANGDGIDLRDMLKESDTVYILPQPFPDGPPSMTTKFPGRLGDCNTRKVSGIFRDWKLDNVSFFNNPTGASSGHKGMVMGTLTAPDYKPRLTDNTSVNVSNSKELESWFKTISFNNGQDNDTCVDMTMVKSYDGRWTLDSDLMGGFFPIDDFDNPNNIKYLDRVEADDPTGKMHNFHFSMEMHLQFVYNQGEGLEFGFRGDDDVWIFVNNKLAIDLGGLQDRARDTLYLDKERSALGLVDGETYNMDIFFAERNPVGSNLLIQTTMDLHNSGELYYKDVKKSDGSIQYDIWQQIETEENDCGLTRMTSGEELSSVDFYIDGPSFSKSTQLAEGTHYGGVIVKNASRVVIDSLKITDLLPGDYKITFISKFNKERSGYLSFTVPQIPDHLDLLSDSMAIDPTEDAMLDSLLMDVETDTILLKAVIRDKIGNYMVEGSGLKWKSSDENVVTVSSVSGEASKARIIKVDKGSAWVIVSKEGLKSDSVFVTADAKPAWPFIRSAVMTDKFGNCIPDVLKIELSDTFKADQVLKSVELTYRKKTYTIPASDCVLDGTNLSVPFITKSGVDYKPEGTVTIVADIRGEEETNSSSFTDGVGPILIAVEVLEKDGNDLDILYLTFSEPVDKMRVSGEQYYLIKEGTADTSKLTLLRINDVINDSMYAAVVSEKSSSPAAGDSLRLIAGVDDGYIVDWKENSPHIMNPPVVITLRKGAAGIEAAWYKDKDADGLLDAVFVKFRRSIDISELDAVTVELNQTRYTVNAGKFAKVNDDVISVPINTNFGISSNIVTCGAMYMIQKYKSVDVTRTSEVADSAAPVIVKAKFISGGYNDGGELINDTLQVTYSESVRNAVLTLFSLVRPESEYYHFEVSQISVNGIDGKYLVNAIVPSGITPSKVDSIWINENGCISDLEGVMQTNENNRRVILEVVRPKPEWMVKNGPNPVHVSDELMTIMVAPKRTVDMKLYRAKITIVDGLGNMLVNENMGVGSKAFSYFWGGCNSKGRLVGAGTYIATIKVFENDELIMSEIFPVGIRR